MLNFVGKFGIILLGSLFSFFIFVFLYRLNNGIDAFIGISDISDFLNNNAHIVSDSWTDLINDIKSIFNDFASSFSDTSSFTNTWNSIGDFFDAFLNFFKYIGNILYTGFRALFFPLFLIYDIVKYFVSIVVFIGSFFEFLLLV